jgi:diketogulonate reductase-like aldo/keto reductase
MVSHMEYREIAPGEDIPVLGLGTWGIGGRQIEDHRWDDEAVTAIRMAVELGMTHIDTAEYYGAGHSEELVGEAIQFYTRKDLFITTKVWRTNLSETDLLDSMRASLKRLRLDYVDLYLIHWPNPDIPLHETVKAMEKCVDEGYTRHIGVSNFSASLMEEAQSYAREYQFIANQVDYSLMDQKPKMELLPYMRENGTTLISYRPLARGLLAKPGNRVLDELAEKYQKSQAQIALNWLINQMNVVTIPKSVNPVHLLDNIGAVGWSLALDDEIALADSFI